MPDDIVHNPAQHIIHSTAKHLRVIAGPGTGKTYAMKQRLIHLLDQGINPRRILAVTFTRTAAADLVKEISALGVRGCEDIKACTLHAFCFETLSKRNVFDFTNRHPRPIITFNKSGSLQFEGSPLLQDISERIFGNKRDKTKLIKAFEASWARLQSNDPGWPSTPIDRQFQECLLSWLRFHRAMLIGELVPEALKYLQYNPACQERQAFDHIVIDEYQDLNKAEQSLTDILSELGSIAIVGDEDQSIYRFRHAHPEGIREFSSTHEPTHDESLLECHRCPKKIVSMANNLILTNHSASDLPRLNPSQRNTTEGEVHIVQWNELTNEANGIADYVKHLIQVKNYSPGEILILSPRRIIGYGIKEALFNKHIPTHSFYHEEALEEELAQKAFTLLSLLVNIEDRVALRYWLGFGSNTWLEKQYKVLRNHCESEGQSPSEALEKLLKEEVVLPGTNRLVTKYKQLKADLQEIESLTGMSLVDKLFPSNTEWAQVLREASEIVLEGETTPDILLEKLITNITQPVMPEGGDFVRIMSLHKSKGLTSRAVIVAGCIEGIIPIKSQDEPLTEQEEILKEQRRLFYVATTRAKEILVLSSVLNLDRALAHKMGAIVLPGGRVAKAITSQFISELGSTAPRSKNGRAWQAGNFR